MLTHSESIAKLAVALVKVAAEIENPTKNAKNPHFGNRYADLAECVSVSRDVLARHGLVIIQCPGMEDARVTVSSMLLHDSGEWIKGVSSAPIPKADPQGVGSATSYLRRYSLTALLGLAQEDDDGNAGSAEGRDKNTGEKHAQTPNPMRDLTGEAPKGGAPPKDRGSDGGRPSGPTCPQCSGACYDNRTSKKTAKSPDYKCKDASCGWAMWVPAAVEQIKKEAQRLADAGAIKQESVDPLVTACATGELDALETARSWLADKARDYQGAA